MSRLSHRANQIIREATTNLANQAESLSSPSHSAEWSATREQISSLLDGDSAAAIQFFLGSSALIGDIDADTVAAAAAALDGILRRLFDAAAAQLTTIKARIAAHTDPNKDLGYRPADDGISGPIQQLLEEIALFDAALDESDLVELDIATDGSGAPMIGQLRESIAEVMNAAQRAQWLSYNRWALAEVYVAATSDDWPERIGAIRMADLHPAVATLHAVTLDERTRQLTNPEERRSAAFRQLRSTPVLPSRF